jgi:hypothetical protein
VAMWKRRPDQRDAEINRLSQRVEKLENKVEDIGKKLGEYSLHEAGLSEREIRRMLDFQDKLDRFKRAQSHDLEKLREIVLQLHELQRADHSRIGKLVTQTRPSASGYSSDSRRMPHACPKKAQPEVIPRPTTAPHTRPRGRLIPPAIILDRRENLMLSL